MQIIYIKKVRIYFILKLELNCNIFIRNEK